MTDAFDADVLIYAANGLPLGMRARHLIEHSPDLIGSLLLLTETLAKPLRRGDTVELEAVSRLVGKLDLKIVDLDIADASVTLCAKYGLRHADAIHLATAVVWGAERFHTNNRKDFGPHITEVEVVWPRADTA